MGATSGMNAVRGDKYPASGANLDKNPQARCIPDLANKKFGNKPRPRE